MSGMGFTPPDPFQFLYANPYNPGGSMGFNPNGLGGAIAPMATQYLMQFAGPTNFLPHQNPAQAVTDQLAMRQYFGATQANLYDASRAGTGHVAARMAGTMAAFTREPLTDLNRQQAYQMAEMANNPHIKPFLAAMVGPERLEAMMFGTRGDPAALAASANRVGYYRRDPDSGATRMDASSLEDFTRGVYSSMYEPNGNIEEMAQEARKGSTDRLRKAAKAEHEKVVSDTELSTRISDLGAEEVSRIYKKYQPGGSAVTVAEQARELTKFDRAIKETGVLASDEASVAGLQRRAEQASVQSMHGFAAGQAGQVMENLFQKGMLPQSIGALSAADRVKVISEQNLDDTTMSRLAREFGHRDLLANNAAYRDADRAGNAAERDRILTTHMPDYEQRVRKSLDAVKTAQKDAGAGPVKIEDAERLLSMDGMDSVAANVDAGRASSVVKKHTEALAAIRQIFGDSGNTDAPVPALLAALDQLSHGAASRMNNSSRVASTLREMRGMAKEMGMGLPAMLNLSATVDAYGAQMGLSGEVKTEATANAMSLMHRMRQQGAFDPNRGFGSLNEGEMQQRAAVMATRTEGSVITKGAAAFRRAYAQNKDKYAGTELEAIATKMDDPNWDGSYEWKGEKRNFYQEAGQDKMRALNRIAGSSNMTPTQLQTLMRDFQTQEYQTNADGLKAARHEFIDTLSNVTMAGSIRRAVGGTGGALDAQTPEAMKGRRAAGQRMVEMMLEASDIEGGEEAQLDYLEKNMESEIAKTLEAQNIPPAEARTEAKRLMDNMYGTDPKDRRARIQEQMSRANVETERLSQGEYRSLKQIKPMLSGASQIGDSRRESGRTAEIAHRTGEFYQGTPIARGSDYMGEIGLSGEGFNFDDFLKETFGIAPNSEVRDRIAPQLQGAFTRAQEQISSATVTDKYLRKLQLAAEGKLAPGEGAVDYEGKEITGKRAKDELRSLATRGMSKEQLAAFDKKFAEKKEISEEQLKEKRKAKLGKMDEKEVTKLYKDTFGAAGLDVETDVAAQRAALAEHAEKGNAIVGLGDEKVLGEGEWTQRMMAQAARAQSGGTEKDEGFRAEYERQRKQGRARFTGLFGRSEGEIRTGLQAALYGDAKAGGYTIQDKDMSSLMELGMYKEGDEEAQKKFETALGGMKLTDKQRQQVRQTFQDFRAARDTHMADYLDPNTSSTPDAPMRDAPGAPGSAQRGAALEEGKTGSRADAAAKGNEGTKGPVKEGEAAAAAAADKAAKGPGADAATAAADKAAPGSAKAAATEGTTLPPQPGAPTAPEITPKPDGAKEAPRRPFSMTPEEEAEYKQRQGSKASETLANEMGRLTTAVSGLTEPIKALTNAMKPKGDGGAAPTTTTAAIEKSFKELMDSLRPKDEKNEQKPAMSDIDRSEMRQQITATRVAQQNNEVHRRSAAAAGGGSGGSGGQIRGTLTLVGLQSAMLAARGSPVFTPVGDGPSILPGNPRPGPNLSSSAVVPIA